MPRIAHVNGRYVPHAEAAVHIEDRGYQFADGVYEVFAVHGGRLIDEKPHLDRLGRSLNELRIAWPMARESLRVVIRETVRRNRIDFGTIYLQVTRGVARRHHAFPSARTEPSLVIAAQRMRRPRAEDATTGVAVVTIPDNRWDRCDIKSIALLANVLGKQRAVDDGADEAWFVDVEGNVTEGTSSNAWIVDGAGTIVTHPLGPEILGGVTRQAIIALAAKAGIAVAERPFAAAAAKTAAEAFLTSSSAFLRPVVSIDGTPVGTGAPGPVARKLHALYVEELARGRTA
jgi:D-alanine transaminase